MKKLLGLSIALTLSVPALAQTQSIVDIAVGNPDFSTLVTALQAAGLVETLQGAGPFTVFAPTNAAFAKVDPATLAALLNDKAALTRVLTYHVVAGKVLAADVVKLTSAKTVEGSDVNIAVMGSMVMLNGSTTVTATDIQASNGVIHVIDSVLLPPYLIIAAAATPAAPPASGSAVDAVLADPQFSTLAAALTAADLVETLKGAGPFTIFAPTNDAFAKLGEARIARLLANKEQLTKYLTYHVLSGKVLSSDIVGQNIRTAPTVAGGNVNIRVSNGKVIINSRAEVTQA
ncbi:MAG: fasciclin domain-containing protein, partial [Pseudopedobacter sp.]|nr:fasciclin domain-containing protein [Deinococcales bacterium]